MLGGDTRLVQALESFDIPVYYAEVPDDELENMNYFYYRETRLDRDKAAYFKQTIEIAYVSMYQENFMEEEIIEAIEGSGFRFQNINYERIKLQQTNNFIDLVIFTFTKPLKRRKCM